MLDDTLQANEGELNALRGTFEEHSYLWKTDLGTFFKEFCEDAVKSTALATYLDIDKFDQAIAKYEGVRSMVQKCPGRRTGESGYVMSQLHVV